MKVAPGRQLAIKFFNAISLVSLRAAEGTAYAEGSAPAPGTVEDAWILSRLERAKESTAKAIEAFEFHRAALGLYDFVHGELCDWYLEIVKPRLYADDNDAVSRFTLHVLAETLAVAHPVIPFVTEELWGHVPGTAGLLMAHPYPEPDRARIDAAAEQELGRAIAAVQELRGWRDRIGAAPSAIIPARLQAEGYERTAAHVARLARLDLADAGANGAEPVATITVPGGSVAVLPTGAVDLGAAQRRIDERRAWLDSEIARAEKKLAHQGFHDKAPEAVVAAERAKLAALRAELDGL